MLHAQEFVDTDYSSLKIQGRMIIRDNSTGYQLWVDSDPIEYPAVAAHHQKGNLDVYFSFQHVAGQTVLVTARDMRFYSNGARELEVDVKSQYLEVGAGLGEMVPDLVRRSKGRLEHRPIIIDIADYQVMRRMLAYAREQAQMTRIYRDRFAELMQRIDIITDPKKTVLVNECLGNIMRSHPELIGSADVLIDNCGASYYPEIDEASVWSLEKRLVKPRGKICSGDRVFDMNLLGGIDERRERDKITMHQAMHHQR